MPTRDNQLEVWIVAKDSEGTPVLMCLSKSPELVRQVYAAAVAGGIQWMMPDGGIPLRPTPEDEPATKKLN